MQYGHIMFRASIWSVLISLMLIRCEIFSWTNSIVLGLFCRPTAEMTGMVSKGVSYRLYGTTESRCWTLSWSSKIQCSYSHPFSGKFMFPRAFFLWGFPTTMRATCFIHVILLHLVSLVIIRKKRKLCCAYTIRRALPPSLVFKVNHAGVWFRGSFKRPCNPIHWRWINNWFESNNEVYPSKLCNMFSFRAEKNHITLQS